MNWILVSSYGWYVFFQTTVCYIYFIFNKKPQYGKTVHQFPFSLCIYLYAYDSCNASIL